MKIDDYLENKGLTKRDILNMGGVFLEDNSFYHIKNLKWINKFRGFLQYKKASYLMEGVSSSIFLPVFSLTKEVTGILIRKMSDVNYHDSYFLKNFNKTDNLFGLHATYKHVISNNKVYLVEGAYDCLKLLKEGLYNVISLMGTHLSEDHVLLLRMFTENVCFALDGDKAGSSASLEIKNRYKDVFNFTHIPLKKDPDVFVKDNGLEKFLALEKKYEEDLIKIP